MWITSSWQHEPPVAALCFRFYMLFCVLLTSLLSHPISSLQTGFYLLASTIFELCRTGTDGEVGQECGVRETYWLVHFIGKEISGRIQ